jgi:hypothetical protein
LSITFACDCGRTINAPDTAAGKKARCPGCGDLIKVPDADDPKAVAAVVATASQAAPSSPLMPPRQSQSVPAPTPAPAAASPSSSHPPPLWAAPSMPLEPWYYGVLEFFAWVWVVGGIGQFVVAAVVLFQSFPPTSPTTGSDLPMDTPATPAWPLFFASCVALLGAVLSAGIVLLAVDAARNVRAIRWKP